MIAEDTPSDTDVQSESANIHGMPVDPDTPLVKTKRETQQQVLKRLHTVSSSMLVQRTPNHLQADDPLCGGFLQGDPVSIYLL